MRIIKSPGLNKSEGYLAELCNRTFLSMWSYPNLYRAKGKELADLIVAFGEHILIFSDKDCAYPTMHDPNSNWRRWFRRAVKKSAQQLWGAERWIQKHPNLVFLNRACTEMFPFEIDAAKANIHLVLVAHGASNACMEAFAGGSGSMMLHSPVKGLDAHTRPFVIGDLESTKTFVHVLDDTTLDIVMAALDTISDFVSYLSKKEELFRSDKEIFVTGEDDLLPFYMTKMKEGEHDFDFPDEYNGVLIPEGHWQEFCDNPQRKAQIEEDKISYFWDDLIEKFNTHALEGSQYWVDQEGIISSEKVMRFLASTTRFERRILSKCFLGIISKTPADVCGRRVYLSTRVGMPFYVFVAFPKNPAWTEKENREVRRRHLIDCCTVIRSMYSNAKDIVGLATESGPDVAFRSEDSLYLDGRFWNEEMQKDAEEVQRRLGIFTRQNYYRIDESEFPAVANKTS